MKCFEKNNLFQGEKKDALKRVYLHIYVDGNILSTTQGGEVADKEHSLQVSSEKDTHGE